MTEGLFVDLLGELLADPSACPLLAPRDEQRPKLLELAPSAVTRRFTRKWFDEQLLAHRPSYPRLRLAQVQQLVPHTSYLKVRGPIFPNDPLATEVTCDPELVQMLVTSGATAVWDRIEDMDIDLAAVSNGLMAVAPTSVQSNLYVAEGVDEGFGIHADSVDVLAMQASGRKRWVVTSPDDRQHVLLDTVLEEGQAVYIPTGYLHRVVGLGESTAHVSMSFGLPTMRSYLQWLAARVPEAAATTLVTDLSSGGASWERAIELVGSPTLQSRFLAEYSTWWLPEGRR